MRLTAAGSRLALLLSSAAPGATAVAQVDPGERLALTGRLDVFWTTRDRWRGIRRNAHPVVQADGLAGVMIGSLSLSGGGWVSRELGDTRNEVRPDLRADTRINQWSAWGQLAYRTGPLTLAAGVIRDWYPRVGPNPAVTEAFSSARLQAGRWTPSVSLWKALDGADGTYLEPTIAFHHFVNPFTGPAVSWTTTLRGGFQLGRRDPDAGASVPGPEETGLTHVALGTGLRVAVNLGWKVALVAAAGLEAQVNRDPATKRQRDGSDADFRLWWPLQVGLSCPLRRPE